jgi:hypothetical protein
MTEEVVLGGNLDHRRPGRGAARDLASAANGRVDFRSLFRAQLGLGHGSRDGELVHVVELECLSRVAPDPASEHEHGDSIEISFGNPRERVRQSCSGNHVHRRKLPGSTRDSIGHERSALFIGDEDWAHALGTGK